MSSSDSSSSSLEQKNKNLKNNLLSSVEKSKKKKTKKNQNINQSLQISSNNLISSSNNKNNNGDQTQLQKQNKKLRKKLKLLSLKLDQQIQRAVQQKLKAKPHANYQNTSNVQSHNLQLQNAYKVIDRLQKTVKEFESKESYQVSVRRIMDLQSLIKKKQGEAQQYKSQIKTLKKAIKDKDKHIDQLIQNSKKMTNPTQDKQMINKLKDKMRKLITDNQNLKKKELEKHQKLVTAQRKLVQIEQTDETPIGRQQSLLKDLQQCKNKYKQAMQRVQRQNIYIVKLNQRLSITADRKPNGGRTSQGVQKQSRVTLNRSIVSKSVEDIPDYSRQKKKIRSSRIDPNGLLLEHLPSPHIKNLKRY